MAKRRKRGDGGVSLRKDGRWEGRVVVGYDDKSLPVTNRSVILPVPVLDVLRAYKETMNSRWMFPSPVSEDSPRDPAAVRKRLQTVLERAECKKIRFHDLRHTFSTTALEHGMDIKTLSTIIGHVSSSTTLNIYAHVTDEMRRTAAVKIDQGIGKTELQAESQLAPRKPVPSTFQAHKGQRRKAGTGCVTQINEKLWEGRYSPIWPDGKKHPRNIYRWSEFQLFAVAGGRYPQIQRENLSVSPFYKVTVIGGFQRFYGSRCGGHFSPPGVKPGVSFSSALTAAAILAGQGGDIYKFQEDHHARRKTSLRANLT